MLSMSDPRSVPGPAMIDTLQPADVRTCWEDTVLPGLWAVKAKTAAPWRPEDVYVSLVIGVAHLYVGEPGFVIVQPKVDPFTGEPELLVWVAYSVEQDSVERFQAAVDDIARQGGFTKLTMWSNRPGWQKVEGWTQVSAVYERRLHA